MCKFGPTFCKGVFIVVNTFLLVIAIVLAATAGYVAFQKSDIHSFIHSTSDHATFVGLYLLMISGILMAIATIIGYIGAIKESKGLLIVYFYSIAFLLTLEVAGVALCFTKYRHFRRDVIHTLSTGRRAHMPSVLTLFYFGKVQRHKKCCGWYGPSDYGSAIPRSCRKYSHGVYFIHMDSGGDWDTGIETNSELGGGESARALAVTAKSTTATLSASTTTSIASTTSTLSSTSATALTTVASSKSTTSKLVTTQAIYKPTTSTTRATPPTTVPASPTTTTSAKTVAANPTTVATSLTTVATSPTTTTEQTPPSSNKTSATANSTVNQATTFAPSPSSTTTPTSPTSTTQPTTQTSRTTAVPSFYGNYYQEGCKARIRPLFLVPAGVGLAMMILQLLGIIFSCCLLAEIKRGYGPLA